MNMGLQKGLVGTNHEVLYQAVMHTYFNDTSTAPYPHGNQRYQIIIIVTNYEVMYELHIIMFVTGMN